MEGEEPEATSQNCKAGGTGEEIQRAQPTGGTTALTINPFEDLGETMTSPWEWAGSREDVHFVAPGGATVAAGRTNGLRQSYPVGSQLRNLSVSLGDSCRTAGVPDTDTLKSAGGRTPAQACFTGSRPSAPTFSARTPSPEDRGADFYSLVPPERCLVFVGLEKSGTTAPLCRSQALVCPLPPLQLHSEDDPLAIKLVTS